MIEVNIFVKKMPFGVEIEKSFLNHVNPYLWNDRFLSSFFDTHLDLTTLTISDISTKDPNSQARS